MTRPKTRRPIADRLWSKVRKEDVGCWEYQGKRSSNGYGRIALGGRADGEGPAHRVAWELTNGEVPEGLIVCHRCDNPPCVNPEHLFLGTHADNAADRNAKGRHAHGTRHPQAILNPDLVRLVRRWAAEGVSRAESARRLGVSRGGVSAVVNGRLWTHVTDDPSPDMRPGAQSDKPRLVITITELDPTSQEQS